MSERLNAFYNMWKYSNANHNDWTHYCKINDIVGHIAYIACVIEMVFEFQYFDEEEKETFWLNNISFYPDNLSIVPAALNIKFIWNGVNWQIDQFEVLDDNLDSTSSGEKITILGRMV